MGLIKTVGNSGQISLGKEFAGRSVLVDQIDKGVWTIKLGEFVPDNERWLFSERVQSELDESIDWAEQNPPKSCDLIELESRIKNEPTKPQTD